MSDLRRKSGEVAVGECPKKALHTAHPEGYLAHLDWMKRKSQTHRQIRCPACGLWAVWVPKLSRPERKREALG